MGGVATPGRRSAKERRAEEEREEKREEKKAGEEEAEGAGERMRREGRIRGYVLNLESLRYVRASPKPTSRTKTCPGGCNIPRCRFCRLHPVGKSASKSKGSHKARGLDITANHLMDEWTLNGGSVKKSLDALHLARIHPFAKWAEMKKDAWEDDGGKEDEHGDDDPLLESHTRLALSSTSTVGHCGRDVIQQFPSSLCQNDSQVQSEGIAATLDGHSDNGSCWSEIGSIDPTGDMELDDWTFISGREEP